MKRVSKAAVGGLLWLTFSALAFGDTLQFTGQPESVEYGGQFTADLASNPTQQLLIYCVDYLNDIGVPSVEMVNISTPNLLVSPAEGLADTRYGSTSTASFSFYNSGPGALTAFDRYVLAAWLTTQYTFSSGITPADDQIQNAIWTLLDVNGQTFTANGGLGPSGNNYVMQAEAWMVAQQPTYLTAFESDIRIYTSTDATSYTTGGQEMIGLVSSTPEPATIALLGVGLLGIGLFQKRKQR